MTPPPLDLLIIGAGPIGLTTAAAALQRGARSILVVEQARQLRPVGQNIDLLPNAYRFLCHLVPDVQPALQPFLHKFRPGKPRFLQFSADGTPIAEIDTSGRGPAASMFWWQLQNLLLNVLPPDILVLNHQLVDIVHDDQEHLVYAKFAPDRRRENRFKNWLAGPDDDGSSPDSEQAQSPAGSSHYFTLEPETALVSCAAKVIVGADGINSVARRCVYRDTCPAWENYADALYSGISLIGSTVPPGVIPENHQLSLDFVDKARIAVLTCNPDTVAFDTMRISLMHNDGTSKIPFDWGVVHQLPIDEHIVRNASDEDLQRFIIDKTRTLGFSEDIVILSRQVWASSKKRYFRLPCSIVPAAHPPPYDLFPTAGNANYPDGFKRPWHYGRVVLAGDAAHGSPPFLGQGTAMGMEDVYMLMEALFSRGVWSSGENNGVHKEVLREAFEEYYARRIQRICFVQKYVMNRISEYDTEKMEQVREKLWTYGPSAVKEELVRG